MSAPLILSSPEKVKSPPAAPAAWPDVCSHGFAYPCPHCDYFWVGGLGHVNGRELARRRVGERRDQARDQMRRLEYAIETHLYHTPEQRLALIARLVLLREQGVMP